MKQSFAVILVCCFSLLSTGVALADTIDLTYKGYLGSRVSLKAVNSSLAEIYNNTTAAGPYKYDLTNPLDSNGNWGGFGQYLDGTNVLGFCIDLYQFLGSDRFTIMDLTDAPVGGAAVSMSDKQAENVAKLWAAHYAKATDSLVTPLVSRLDEGNALSLAIWEVIYETEALATGEAYNVMSFQGGATDNWGFMVTNQVDVSNNAIQLANNWLAGMRSLTTLAPLKAIENSAKQGQAVMFNPEELPNVPAPAAAVNLAALGLVFGGWFGFRRSRANSAK